MGLTTSEKIGKFEILLILAKQAECSVDIVGKISSKFLNQAEFEQNARFKPRLNPDDTYDTLSAKRCSVQR